MLLKLTHAQKAILANFYFVEVIVTIVQGKKVFLHFAIKISELACEISRNRVPNDSASIPNRVFKGPRVKTRDYNVIVLSEVVPVIVVFKPKI